MAEQRQDADEPGLAFQRHGACGPVPRPGQWDGDRLACLRGFLHMNVYRREFALLLRRALESPGMLQDGMAAVFNEIEQCGAGVGGQAGGCLGGRTEDAGNVQGAEHGAAGGEHVTDRLGLGPGCGIASPAAPRTASRSTVPAIPTSPMSAGIR